MATPGLDSLCDLLAERYGAAGAGAGRRLRSWLSGELPQAHEEILARHLDPRHAALVFDAFWQILPFGTGGRRGRVGYGANRMNETTVAMTVQGHCDYLRRTLGAGRDLEVVVANDVRVFRDVAGTYAFLGDAHPLLGVSSRRLARLACEIYAGNGIRAWCPQPERDDATLTTPELSFLIAELGAAGGVNLSASHNPPDDSGVKIYDGFGSQPIAPDDQALIDVMETATRVKSLPFAQALAQGLVAPIPARCHTVYLDLYEKLYGGIFTPRQDLPITYTPLCGCGLDTVGDVLARLGFPVRVPDAERPDGSFAAIPFRAPNPEVFQATAPARAFAEAQGSTIVLSSDPDADRVGVEIRLADGSWFHFDGNQIATVLAYYLMLDPEGPRRRGLVIATLVTTRILRRIVEEAGDSLIVDDLLVGFKYVADVLKRLARGEAYRGVACAPEQLVLAAEESHGVIMLPTIRDKDASPACMYLAALHQREAARGRTLLDYFVAILERLGGYDSVNRSIVMQGADGILKKDRIMASLRESPPDAIGGEPVRRVVDYWDEAAFGPFASASDRLPRDVIQVQTDAFVVTIRPSGTEPKLKLYCQLLPKGEAPARTGQALLAAVRERADAAARQVYADLLARIGASLDTPALLLPDLVDLDRKLAFQTATVPALRGALAAGRFDRLDALLGWLRGEIAAMTPGTDPLPAAKASLAHLAERWREELGALPLLGELSAWARS
jgi:phosphoglucomutase/phosphomannomutase